MKQTVVTIEIPKGSNTTYVIDPLTGRVRLGRELSTSLAYPANFGFIEQTLTEREERMDAFVLLRSAVFPGVQVEVRVIGALVIEDRSGSHPKLISVPAHDPRWNKVRSIEDVPAETRSQIEFFFKHHKDPAPHARIRITGWANAEQAVTLVDLARLRYETRASVVG